MEGIKRRRWASGRMSSAQSLTCFKLLNWLTRKRNRWHKIFSFVLLHRLHWLIITLIKLTRPLLTAKLWPRRHRQLSHSWKLEKVAVYTLSIGYPQSGLWQALCAEWSNRHVSEFGDSCWTKVIIVNIKFNQCFWLFYFRNLTISK